MYELQVTERLLQYNTMSATLNFQCLKSEEKIPNFTTQGNSIQTSYREIIETYGTKRNTKNMYKKLQIQNSP